MRPKTAEVPLPAVLERVRPAMLDRRFLVHSPGPVTDGGPEVLSATPDLGVCAVWSPHRKAQRVTWGRTRADHFAEDAIQRRKGMRLAQVFAYTRHDQVLYDAIWDPGKQTQQVVMGWTEDELHADQIVRIAKGFRPLRVQGYSHLNAGGRYNVIYEPGSGASQILLCVTDKVLSDEYEQARKKGMRMTSLSSHTSVLGLPRYSAVFRTANTDQRWFAALPFDEMVREYESQHAAGFRIRDLSVVKTGNGHRWTALFEREPSPQVVYWAHVRERITEVYDAMWKEGMKLRGMCVVRA
ncbi:MAG TPA: hypothetical protein VEU30_15805 [Thermoanaerobaculia bacterium]|nr:hypothetical protein [Thermoanaerobaculia bacterium]